MKRQSIFISTVQVTALTFGIKILGLIKQVVLATYCGATDETDAFFIATGIIVQLCAVIFSAISISFLSIHTERLIKEGREESNKLVNKILRFFIPLAILLSLIFLLFAPTIAKIFAPAYDDTQLGVLTVYIRIMSSAFVFWGYFLTVNVVLETDKKFLPGKGQGFFQNLFLIIAAVFLFPKYGIVTLVIAFLLSGIIQCVLVTFCARNDFKILFCKIESKGEIKKLLLLAVPLIMGNAIYEINDIVDKQISTYLGSGNVSVLTYGGTINDIVTGVIVTSVATVIFAHYATWIADGQIEKVEDNLTKCIEYLTLIIFPIMIMCIIAGDQLVAILYGRGSFGHDEVLATYFVVIGYAVGFIFQAARANVVKVFYAFQDTKTPMINGGISVAVNVTLSFILSKYIGIAGVALATSIAMFIVTFLLFISVRKYLPSLNLANSLKEIVKGICAAIVTAVMVLLVRRIISASNFGAFIIEGFICVALYCVCLMLLRAKIMSDLLMLLKKMKK